MTTNRRGRTGCNQATPKVSKSNRNSSDLVPHIKGFVVTHALWGWLPMRLARWLVSAGETDDQ